MSVAAFLLLAHHRCKYLKVETVTFTKASLIAWAPATIVFAVSIYSGSVGGSSTQ